MLNKDGIFLVINKESDWKKGLEQDTACSPDGLILNPVSDYQTEKTLDFAGYPELSGSLEATAGKCGILYLLDRENLLLGAYDYDDEYFVWLKSLQRICSSPAAIAFLPGTFYILDRPEGLRPKIIAVAQINHQVRWVISDAVRADEEDSCDILENFTPLAISSDEKGQLWALARYGEEEDVAAVVRIHPGGYVDRRHLVQVELASHAVFRAGGGFWYLADQSGNSLLRYPVDEDALEDVHSRIANSINRTAEGSTVNPESLAIDPAGNLYLANRMKAGLSDQEDRRFIHRFDAKLNSLGRVPGYRGSVDRLWFDNTGRLFILDGKQRQIKTMEVAGSFTRDGVYISASLDSTAEGTRWHKLLIQAAVPEGTEFKISYLAADQKRFTVRNGGKVTAVIKDLDEAIATRSRTLTGVMDLLPWQALPASNPHDALIRGAHGRYLWLKIDLMGDQGHTPAIQGIQAYFAASSYLDYLPAIYREDTVSADFLERFLTLFQTFLLQSEGYIDRMTRCLDADSAAGDFLRWLGSWLGIEVSQYWTEDKVRQLVKKAPLLYKQRGTREGMLDLLEILTGTRPVIVENFQTAWAWQDADLKEAVMRLYGDDPFTFHVLFSPGVLDTAQKRLEIQKVIDREKPAHTRAEVVPLQPWIQLGGHTYLCVNSCLGRPNPRLDVGSVIPRDAVLTDIKEASQVERRSRAGMDTRLT